jgi:hypothetical protein
MIQFSQQYEIISKLWQSFKNGKKSEKVRISKDDLDYAKIHYNKNKFENYTLDNFINVILYILFNDNPTSKTDLLKEINSINKNKLLDAIKFKNGIINYKNTLNTDEKLVERLSKFSEESNIYNLYLDNKISLLFFYLYYKNNIDKLKGRIAKREFKKISILLEFFDDDLEDNLNKYAKECKWI